MASLAVPIINDGVLNREIRTENRLTALETNTQHYGKTLDRIETGITDIKSMMLPIVEEYEQRQGVQKWFRSPLVLAVAGFALHALAHKIFPTLPF